MTAQDLISAMISTKVGSRELDAEIAKLLGWRTRPLEVTNGHTGDITRRTVWVDPKTNQPANVPFYSTDLQAAYDLAIWMAPQAAGALIIDGQHTRVQLGDAEPNYHSDPVLALCLAAFKAHPEG